MSRTVSDEKGGMMFFGAHEKNVFAKQLRKQAEFAGIEVLTWCMMDNHFHLLIRVPARQEFIAGLMANGRRRFWKHLGALYSRQRVKAVREKVEELEGDQVKLLEILEVYTRRMADLAAFMQGVKHSFSVWFNRKHGREGTVWMRRYKSVYLEGDSVVLRKVAAYIDLNPIRAGLVKDPGNYRWSGYGQALGGDVRARRGLSAVHGYSCNQWRLISGSYRRLLYLEGVEKKSVGGRKASRGFSEEEFYREAAEVSGEGGGKRLARRVRYFSDGLAIGGRAFLERVFEHHREKFGVRRKTGARRFRGPMWKGAGLFSLRDLRSG
jgi:REP element-mobilizing transposase RayT